jgi:hypothetical protein
MRSKAIVLSSLFLPFFLSGATAQPDRYGISNDSVLMRLDADGRLAELTNLRTKHAYVAAPRKAPWRMFYRHGDALDLEIEPDRQKAAVRQQDGELTINYDSLTAQTARRGETRELKVRFVLRARLADDRIVWTATVENREPEIEVTEIWMPWLHGIGHLGLGPEADVLYWPEAAGRRVPNPYSRLAETVASSGAGFRGEGPSYRLTYPWAASMQWFTLNNGDEGLYIGGHDKTLMTTALNVMAHDERVLSASIVKYPFVTTGETWTSEPVVVRLYQGGWHVAARTYRAWADTWMQVPNPPDWIRRAPGWAHPALGRKGQWGTITGRYSDYPAMLKDARSLGLNTLIVFGWVKQGFDNRYPHYDPDEAMGGAEGLRGALADVALGGGRTILYTQGQLIDPTTEYYRAEGHRVAAKDVWGYEYREQYAFGGAATFLHTMRNKYFGVACPTARGWAEQLQSQFEMVKGHGAQGIIFDQMGGRPPYICFNKDHPHVKPSLAAGPGKVANMRRLRETIKARDPEFLFVIELLTDCYTPFADIIHAWGPGFYPAPESYGALFRYTFPETIATNRSGGPHDKKTQYGHAYSLGWRFDAQTRDAHDPEVAGYLARLSELRSKFPDLLLEGRFVDNENFVCDNNSVAAHGFLAGERLAVTLWNPTRLPQKARVLAPGYTIEEVSWMSPELTGPDHSLLPNDVAVLVFRKR